MKATMVKVVLGSRKQRRFKLEVKKKIIALIPSVFLAQPIVQSKQ